MIGKATTVFLVVVAAVVAFMLYRRSRNPPGWESLGVQPMTTPTNSGPPSQTAPPPATKPLPTLFVNPLQPVPSPSLSIAKGLLNPGLAGKPMFFVGGG